MNARLRVDELADPRVVEEPPHALRRDCLDYEFVIDARVANVDILHAQRLAEFREETGAVDLEPEALRVEIGSAQPREGLVHIAGALRVRVERDDPVARAGLDGRLAEEAAFVKLSVHLAGELPPDLVAARPEEGFEKAHRSRTTG